jgi:bifunctional DNA-binding transcriptional regulator/antitoxin component of YhaV-PrlF toxin-antitoxin module
VPRFEADLLLAPGTKATPYVVLPAGVAEALGGRARVPISGTVNGHAFRGWTMPQGDGTHAIGFRKEIRDEAGIAVGDRVTIEIERGDAPRDVAVPADLAAALSEDPKVRAAFDAMSYSHRREFVRSILDAKRPQTRERRILSTLDSIRGGPGP